MGAEHLNQSIAGDFRGALQHLEEVADHIRSAQKTFEVLPSASTNNPLCGSEASPKLPSRDEFARCFPMSDYQIDAVYNWFIERLGNFTKP